MKKIYSKFECDSETFIFLTNLDVKVACAEYL